MDLSLTEDQALLKRTAHDFLTTETPESLMRALDATPEQFSRDVWDKMAGLGWMGILVPENYGGLGGSYTDAAVIQEEMGRALQPSTFHSTAVLAATLLRQSGSDAQQADHLPMIANGRAIFALAASEADYGWGADDLRMDAAPEGGEFVLSGAKTYVPDAHVATQLVVAARIGGEGAQGITLFLVDPQTAGVSIRRVEGFYGDRQNQVTFSDVRVPASAVIGTVGQGWQALQAALAPATAVLCAYMTGGLEAVFDMTVEYAKTRRQFGVPIGTFQRVQDHVIEIVNHLDGARWTAYEALWKLDTGKADAVRAVSVAKAITSEAFDRGTFHAHEVHAGMGISREYPLYLYTKKARTLYHYLGDPAFHHNRIADELDL